MSKTITSIAVAGRAYLNRKICRLLIAAPKSIVPVWIEEFEKFADFQYAAVILEGDSGKKVQMLKKLENFKGLQVAVINFESLWRIEKEIIKWNPDMIIADESSKIKNPQAKQSKTLHKLGKIASYKMILTGTPIQNNPLDFFSQYKFLDENIFGSSFYAFRSKYAVMGGYGSYQIVGYKNLSELTEKAHSIAFRVTKKDALDLPETIDETRYVELEAEALKTYKDIKEESYALLSSGEVTTPNILTQLLRLQQVTGGFIRSDESIDVQKVSNAKLNVLEEIIDTVIEEGKKVVVFSRFIPEIHAINKLLQKKKIGFSYITGEVKDRKEAVRTFQEDTHIKVFVAQIQTAGLGITLTAADTAVYYSMDFNYANYSQSRARIHRIGQKNNCTYIHLVVKKTIDEKVIKALQKKEDIAKQIVDNWREFFRKDDDFNGK